MKASDSIEPTVEDAKVARGPAAHRNPDRDGSANRQIRDARSQPDPAFHKPGGITKAQLSIAASSQRR